MCYKSQQSLIPLTFISIFRYFIIPQTFTKIFHIQTCMHQLHTFRLPKAKWSINNIKQLLSYCSVLKGITWYMLLWRDVSNKDLAYMWIFSMLRLAEGSESRPQYIVCTILPQLNSSDFGHCVAFCYWKRCIEFVFFTWLCITAIKKGAPLPVPQASMATYHKECSFICQGLSNQSVRKHGLTLTPLRLNPFY